MVTSSVPLLCPVILWLPVLAHRPEMVLLLPQALLPHLHPLLLAHLEFPLHSLAAVESLLASTWVMGVTRRVA